MNIFYLDTDPRVAAEAHCDKHVVKMILEYGQLLSTAHRLIDGTPTPFEWTDMRLNSKLQLVEKKHKKILYLMPGESARIVPDVTYLDEIQEGVPLEQRKVIELHGSELYLASHQQHPSGIWCRQNFRQYEWLYHLFVDLLSEYTHRYGKVHKAASLKPILGMAPKGIRHGDYQDPPQCMPEEFKDNDAVTAYQNLYVGSKARFARWTNRQPPEWFINRTENYDATHFTRTRAVVL